MKIHPIVYAAICGILAGLILTSLNRANTYYRNCEIERRV